jgi:hypothetical protein
MYYKGHEIIESLEMVDRKQNKTHKKKRINKKWLKRYGITATPKTEIFHFQNKFIMHPTVAQKLKEAL